MMRWLGAPWIEATAAVLIVCLAEPVEAQARHMVELGGGFYAAVPQEDITERPSVATVDTRIVRWWNGNWGVSGRVLVGIGSRRPEDNWIMEHDRLTLVQAVVRYRRALTRSWDLHVGFGGGLLAWRATFGGGDTHAAHAALPLREGLLRARRRREPDQGVEGTADRPHELSAFLGEPVARPADRRRLRADAGTAVVRRRHRVHSAS